ncbi:MAG TPA: DUF1634 domain-containing protein [Methylomirabilota bacterium]
MSRLRAPFSVEHLVARILLCGGLLGIGLVLLGLVLYAGHGGFRHHVLDVRRQPAGPPPGVFVSIRQVVDGLARHPIDPLAVSALGLLVLMVTPAVAVLAALPAFWWTGDRRYALIALVVLALLAVSATLAGSLH